MKIICSQNAAKNLLSLQISQQLFSVKKSTISWRPRTNWSTLKENICICMYICKCIYISLKKKLFQRHSKILSDGMRRGRGKLNNFFEAARCLGLFGSSKFFILIENYFSVLKHRKFLDHMNFIGNIMIKFLIRSPFLSI